MHFYTLTSLLLTIASYVSATLNIHNWYVMQCPNPTPFLYVLVLMTSRCEEPVYIWQSNNGDCDKGPNGLCFWQEGSAPWPVDSGTILQLDWIANNFGTAVKIAKTQADNDGILQFEYTMGNGGNYWDLSNLDGLGANLVGTPFSSDNVRIVPIGPGTGTGGGHCEPILCPGGQTCTDAYLNPEDTKTHVCSRFCVSYPRPRNLLLMEYSIVLKRSKNFGLISACLQRSLANVKSASAVDLSEQIRVFISIA